MAPRPLKRRAVFTPGVRRLYPRQGPGCDTGHCTGIPVVWGTPHRVLWRGSLLGPACGAGHRRLGTVRYPTPGTG